ncbi:adenosylcobinamide-GDP ribazoletransferase [Pyrolobus fumarii]|nr:adenosylcobinamide-GDP ribazoletransferase [Pyrolobus fumarii]
MRTLLALLTRLPVGYASLDEVARCLHLVPLVGLIEALIVSLAFILLLGNPGIAAAVYLVLHLLVTGGLHLDGFADYVDAIASGRRGLEAVRVMKDPRRGSLAAAALAIHSILVYASASTIASARLETILAAMISSYTVACYTMVYLLAFTRPEPYAGMARALQEAAPKSITRAMIVTIACIALAALLDPLATATAVVTGIVTGEFVRRDVEKRVGFSTGDTAGFTYETVRAVALLAAAIAVSAPLGLRPHIGLPP